MQLQQKIIRQQIQQVGNIQQFIVKQIQTIKQRIILHSKQVHGSVQ